MTNEIITGDATEELDKLDENSVHMVMTSPPYWNLRDYDHDDQLGLEETSEEFVQNLADILDKVKRVLRDDGSLWLNLGDTYEDKDLQLVPERVALELQDRGWILRNKVTWAKPNPMPQSVKDRLNDTTEKIFHFVLNKDYFYDLDAIREGFAETTYERGRLNGNNQKSEAGEEYNSYYNGNEDHQGLHREGDSSKAINPAGKNPGDVFEVTTKPFPDAHFAVYPPELCEKPIKATCPPKVCVDCGAAYKRDTEKSYPNQENTNYDYGDTTTSHHDGSRHEKNGKYTGNTFAEAKIKHNGWISTCACDADATLSGIALDPFAGAGTTLLKAKELGRRFMGIELNPEYADMARSRVGLDVNDPSRLREDNESGLEAYQ